MTVTWQAIGVGVVVAIGAYQLGQKNALSEIPSIFVPRFADAQADDYMCMATVQRWGDRTVYAGCFAPHILERVKSEYAQRGERSPFRVVGEFNLELDDW